MKPERWEHIEQIYHAALESQADRRADFLAEACLDDDALRREVEDLLAMNEQSGGFLSRPALELEARKIAEETPMATLALQVGHELSHYKILSHIRSGGMGQVFLARDTILERRVALKLLPVEFTQNSDRLQRFVGEAKAASALNHPNIITIYEIGEVVTSLGDTHFIAAEFIEGETLRTWTVDEGNRVHQVLNIAVQIASALDAAHKAGIVHRDIKPENLMVRPDGLVKVLDFGLAKLVTGSTVGVDSEARTVVEAIRTSPGMILGTPRYMSPEQVRGRGVDARSDIFSLGVVLFELLTGQQLFDGETDADVAAGIIHQDAPPLAQYLAEVPPELERIVQKTLTKDADLRYQNARDLQIDLQALMQNSELSARLTRARSVKTGKLNAQTSGAMTAPRFSLRQVLLVLPVALLLIAITWWIVAGHKTVVATPPIASLTNTEVVRWASVATETSSAGAFSPDGKWVAFTSSKSGSRNIWLRKTVSGDDHQSTRDEFTNESPIWSPDGEEIAFFSIKRGDQLGIWRMPPLGGTPTRLKTLAAGEGSIRLLRWSNDGATIYYDSKQQLFAVKVHSGETTQLTHFEQAKVQGDSLSISADEKRVAYITTEPDGHRSVWYMPLRDGSPIRIVDTAAETIKTVWHPDCERIFYSSNVEGTYQVFVADIKGHQPVQITFGERDSFVVDVSSDGTKVLYGSNEEKSDIWGVNVTKPGDEFVVASDISSELWPDISPDNKTIAYQAVRNLSQGDRIYNCEILTKRIGEKAEPFVLAKDGSLPRWSPDGKQIAFMRREKESFRLKTVNAAGGEEKALVTGGLRPSAFALLPYTRSEVSDFAWSPDGKLAYCSRNDGFYNLRTASADGSGVVSVTNNTDANLFVYCPIWSADGKRIVYTTRPNKTATPQDNIISFWVAELETRTAKLLIQMNASLRLVGWSQTGRELLFVRYDREQQKTNLMRVSVGTGEQTLITELSSTSYYSSILLSPDRRTITYVSHQDAKDNIWVVSAGGGVATRLTANNDPQVYFSSLAWSPDSGAIYYGKQSRYSLLSMVTNFK